MDATFAGCRGRHFWFLVALLMVAVLALPGGVTAQRKDASQARGSGAARDALIVRYSSGVTATAASAGLASIAATEIGRIDELDTRILAVPRARRAQVRRALERDPNVASVEEDGIARIALTPSDPAWPAQWGPRLVKAPQAWDATTGSTAVTIAILDTGVDATHPDLKGKVLAGRNFVANTTNVKDSHGHGTAVAGVAAATANNRAGIAGMCWKCRILPVKVLNNNGSGTHSNIAAGIVWAADRGAQVINLSLATGNSTSVLKNAVAYARSKGVVVVASAGNSGSTARRWPAAYPGVISVAASTAADRRYSWSTYGSWVSMAAPGCAHAPKLGGSWGSQCGTSFAAPLVAGAVGLMRSLKPRASGATIEAALLAAGPALSWVKYGRLNTLGALKKIAPNRVPNTTPPPPPTPTPTATPTPTPRVTPPPPPTPTPTPTPTATPSPTPTATPSPTPQPEDRISKVEWGGRMEWWQSSVTHAVELWGRVEISGGWYSRGDLAFELIDPDGRVIARTTERRFEFERTLSRAEYRLRFVRTSGSSTVWYKARVEPD
ncbi:MAG TPA: S8 family serine peptidase [Candidatus Limnocylindria bacterium]|nr:S8 family serine peptidase [Candidatus Limnocylindria bacterium]